MSKYTEKIWFLKNIVYECLESYCSYLFHLTVFNPTKPHIRTKILKPRGFIPRTDKVPLQVPENIKEVQNELNGRIHPHRLALLTLQFIYRLFFSYIFSC